MTQADAPSTTQETEPSGSSSWVWHNAATWADFLAALRGEAYTALCGKQCQGSRGTLRHRSTLTPIEKCAVCSDLIAGGGA